MSFNKVYNEKYFEKLFNANSNYLGFCDLYNCRWTLGIVFKIKLFFR